MNANTCGRGLYRRELTLSGGEGRLSRRVTPTGLGDLNRKARGKGPEVIFQENTKRQDTTGQVERMTMDFGFAGEPVSEVVASLGG